VEANFIIWHEEEVLQIPASSLFRHNEQWAVYKIENDEARLQTVQIGKHNGLVAQVLQGLNIGDQLIDHPGNEVENHRKIKVR
jgi:HlyD family secretion protein